MTAYSLDLTVKCVLSECQNFRYWLEIDLNSSDALIAMVCGINPSKANARDSDQTVRKLIGFAQRNAIRKIISVNPFAKIMTDIKGLTNSGPCIGPYNITYISRAIAQSHLIIPCWGNKNKIPLRLMPQLGLMQELIRLSGKPVKIFGLTKSGDPKHPLMLPYSTPLQDWKL